MLSLARKLILCVAVIGAVGTFACSGDGEDSHDRDASGNADIVDAGSDATGDLPSDSDGSDTWTDLGIVATVESCVSSELGETRGLRGPWLAEGAVLLFPEADDHGAIRLDAPAVARPTEITLRSEAARTELRVLVEPEPESPDLGPGMTPGCGAFPFGVASGDPYAESVLLWTRLQTEDDAPVSLSWIVDKSPRFESPTASGSVQTRPDADHTALVEVAGLEPGTTYYYRFGEPGGGFSRVGRTRTADAGPTEEVRFALASCSSIYSGYFNAYRRLAERDDVAFVLHVGDYMYDFVDEDEQVRVPEPYPTEPDDLEGHRARHAYYLADPDLRDARAAHPWIVVWDNHDVEAGAPPEYEGGVEAFRDYVPMRLTDPERPAIAWRTFPFGDLLELSVMDILLWQGRESITGTDEPSILGNEQFAWLTNQLGTSTARWHVVGGQKLVSPIDAPVGIGGSTWNAYPRSRARLLDFIRDENVANVVFLSGDAHLTMVADAIAAPDEYDPETYQGSHAVEFLGGSISRGNVDETLGDMDATFMQGLHDTLLRMNPHFAHADLVNHGYAVVDVRPGRLVAEMWFSPILEPADDERFDVGVEVRDGEPHWRRELRESPTAPGAAP